MIDSAKSSDMGDSDDLQALFDSVAAEMAETAKPPDASDELQSLFDSVVAQTSDLLDGSPQDRVFNQLGQMARQLHDTLRELGYDEKLHKAASQIPDARQRLSYIAQMTEQAASRVLNATISALRRESIAPPMDT